MLVQRPSFSIFTALLLSVLAGGCGQAVYEQRLENTKRYYAHLGQLNENLAAAWAGPGISIRPSQGMAFILPPQKPENAEAGAKPAAAEPADQSLLDERQPNYVNIDLPGIVAAWKWETVDAEGQARSQQTSYMYLLSNQEIGINPDLREQALRFHDTTLRELRNTLEVDIPDYDKLDEVAFPAPTVSTLPPDRDGKKREFLQPVKYRIVAPNTDVSNDRTKRTFACHLFTQGEVQVIVLFVYSDVAEHQDLLLKRIPLCLETLSVSGDKVGAPAAVITGPAGAKGPGF